MKRPLALALVASAFALAHACPNVAPKFKLMGTDGKTYETKVLTVKPTILVFMKRGCPENPSAVPVLNALRKKLGGTVQVIGLMEGDPNQVRKEAAGLKAQFLILADAGGKALKGFKATRSVEFTVISSKGEARWAKKHPGLSRKEVQEALSLIEKHGRKIAKPDLSFVPKRAISGCSFGF